MVGVGPSGSRGGWRPGLLGVCRGGAVRFHFGDRRGSLATWITRASAFLGRGDREVALGLGGTKSDSPGCHTPMPATAAANGVALFERERIKKNNIYIYIYKYIIMYIKKIYI